MSDGVPNELQPMPEDWERALVVVAHPDDMEYGASAAVARWTDAGKSVAYLLVTKGEAGIDGMPPDEVGPLRAEEQRAACDLVGVSELAFLDRPDGMLEYGLPIRRDIAAVVRAYRPELVITLSHRETFPGGALNMADHRVVGQAVIDAVRDAANRWVFRELLDAGLEPWGGVRWVALAGSPADTHAVDVTTTLDRGIASLAAHRAYLAGLPDDMRDAEAFLRPMAASTGQRVGVAYAVSFELLAM